jgi:hypothetical protein
MFKVFVNPKSREARNAIQILHLRCQFVTDEKKLFDIAISAPASRLTIQ